MTPFDRAIGRLLIVVTYVASVLLLIGVALMVAARDLAAERRPRTGPQRARLRPAVRCSRPGSCGSGSSRSSPQPISRVVAAAIAFGRAGDRQMVAVALGILAVIAVSITTALAAG